jgi:hypothetical protein
MVWGLTGAQWAAIASIAQGFAALGAITLLIQTWWSQRAASTAIENSRRLAAATDELVRATQNHADLSIRPVLEVSFERVNLRFRLINRGNGPMVQPLVSLNAQGLRLVRLDVVADAYAEVGAIAVNEEVFALASEVPELSAKLSIEGITLSGSRFSARIDIERYLANDTVVAITDFKEMGGGLHVE